MTQPLPNLVNPRTLVERRADVVGRCAVAKMERLRSFLGDDQGDVDVTLAFGKSDEGWSVVTGFIQGEVWLQCQRCLALMPWKVNTGVALALVATEDEAQRIGESYDPRVVSEATLSVHDLVEDELILAMPLVARHPDGVCRSALDLPEPQDSHVTEATPDESTRPRNPFEVLAGLKKKH